MKNLLIFLFLITPFLSHGQFKVEYVINKNDTLSIAITQFPNGELIGGAYAYDKIIQDKNYNSGSALKFSEKDSMVIIDFRISGEKYFLDTAELNKGENTFLKENFKNYLIIVKEGVQRDTINKWLQNLIQSVETIATDTLNQSDLLTKNTTITSKSYIKEVLIGLLAILAIILFILFKKEKRGNNEKGATLEIEQKKEGKTTSFKLSKTTEIEKATKKTNAQKEDLISDNADELKSIQSFLFKVDHVLSENHVLIKKLSSEPSEKMNSKLIEFQKKHEQLKKNWEAIIRGVLDNKSIKDAALKKSIEGITSNNEKIRIIKDKLYVDFLIDYVNDFFILLEEYRISQELNFLTELEKLSSENEKNINILLRDVKELLLFDLHYIPSLTKFDSKNSKHIKLLNYQRTEEKYNKWVDELNENDKDGIIVKVESFGNSFNNSKTILLIT